MERGNGRPTPSVPGLGKQAGIMCKIPSHGLDEFARVEDSIGVQGEFDGAVEFAGRGGDGEGPPAFFGEADAMR